jgi:hypothetical protein
MNKSLIDEGVRSGIVLGIIVMFIFVALLSIVYYVRREDFLSVGNSYITPLSMTDCETRAKKDAVFGDQLNVDKLNEITSYCYSFLRSQQLLNDYNIRRAVFGEQIYMSRILLWMVVIITFSGTTFAGLQLFATYNFATKELATGTPSGAVTRRDGDSEIIVAKDRVVLRTSVIGLIVMVLSLAFFLIFVLYIFKFYETDVDRGVVNSDETTETTPNLAPGGPGKIPEK